MKITPAVFEAYLKCPTKCWLRSTLEPSSGNTYSQWVNAQNDSYRATAKARLIAESPNDEVALSPDMENPKAAKWRLAVSVTVQAHMDSCVLESELHAVERVPVEGRGKPARFIPTRFIFTNKLDKDDKLLLGFDAFALSKSLGREISLGKIIHGDDHTTQNVKTSTLASEVRKRLEKIAALLSSSTPPDLVLNRHCAECEFQARCRQKAVEKDDLSLLSNMNGKERKELHSKGIFTVTQLSYTFRPRRRPKKLRDKRERYHHSLKALAIREKKIHIVGSPELKIDGTPVYLDVEGLPDRDFYYLIGVRIGNGESAVQHRMWADTVEDEGKIWREFLGILETVETPVLIHYGSYETSFFRRMRQRHGDPRNSSSTLSAISSSVNAISVIFAQIYFPTFANGLKEVASWLGYTWTGANPMGTDSVKWRNEWEKTQESSLRNCLISYNTDDCRALELVARVVVETCKSSSIPDSQSDNFGVVNVDGLQSRQTLWPKFSSSISEFEIVNKAARCDYQRSHVYVRTSSRLKRAKRLITRHRREPARRQKQQVSTLVSNHPICPHCGQESSAKPLPRTKPLHDILFGKNSLRALSFQYSYSAQWCSNCSRSFGEPQGFWRKSKYSRNFVAFLVYLLVCLNLTEAAVRKMLARFFRHDLNGAMINHLKSWTADYYAGTRNRILATILRGNLVHVDETRAVVKGRSAYVWVFTSLHEVAYFYSDSREGEIVRAKLAGFQGVLVSDFYGAYDSLACPQQKCLIHLMRDLNRELLNHPFDDELKAMLREFAELLQAIIGSVDQWGLKKRFLRKHTKTVARFYRNLHEKVFNSESAKKIRSRFERHRNGLFTFLDHDGVPWNNNNAEHAIKAFAALRTRLGGTSTPDATDDYLVLLSVCQTCEYMGVDFLDFLRSGEKDIHTFAANHPNPTWRRFVPVERKHYDENFKRSAVERWQKSGKTTKIVAAELDINPWNLDDWRRRFSRSV